MTTDLSHPTRSPEFLSRLHDGDLTAEERRAFESHRETCAACRSAVEDYERTLSAFRAAATHPAASDLSARILRKIRAQSPARRPFDVRFGIDVRWAGIFAAALLVVLISAPFLLRRPRPAPASSRSDAITARILSSETDRQDSSAQAKPPGRDSGARKDVASEAAPPEPAAPPASPRPPQVRERAAEAPSTLAAAPKPESPDGARSFRRRAASPDRAEETTGPGSGELKELESTLRLTIRPLDGLTTAPGLASTPSDERLAPVRGRAFVLVVESGGRVRSVAPASSSEGFVAREKTRGSDAMRRDGSADVLRELRFQPGDRPRRLLVRVD